MLAARKMPEFTVEKDSIAVIDIKGKGRGVIATKFIQKEEIIEICPVIILNKEESFSVEKSLLDHYLFSWSRPGRYCASLKDEKEIWTMLCGFGALYNHSSSPNADFNLDYPARSVVFTAFSNIMPGQEICINYNLPLWFEEK
ncbi:MAG: SET domain-containing protein-lysine N-methyltransferase [Rhodospirillales bacterium]|nr:SET domain-containing protein-lysine N-methyltransferase [Alphaproteobacteria bacterium]USO04378.1 MAG: SET domain-containing protein-lysine N-methyltransferase [Rhodospirillales bacterium]